jgi:hypothetical protein
VTATAVRAAAAGRAAVGLAMLLRPDDVARRLGSPTTGGHPVLRVLGARHLVQAAVLSARPSAEVVAGSVAVDALHVASDLALAAVRGDRRRPALRDAAVSTAVLLATWLTRPRHVGPG